jgi:hypothetical protein
MATTIGAHQIIRAHACVRVEDVLREPPPHIGQDCGDVTGRSAMPCHWPIQPRAWISIHPSPSPSRAAPQPPFLAHRYTPEASCRGLRLRRSAAVSALPSPASSTVSLATSCVCIAHRAPKRSGPWAQYICCAFYRPVRIYRYLVTMCPLLKQSVLKYPTGRNKGTLAKPVTFSAQNVKNKTRRSHSLIRLPTVTRTLPLPTALCFNYNIRLGVSCICYPEHSSNTTG